MTKSAPTHHRTDNSKNKNCLILGGIRSGKSRHGLHLANLLAQKHHLRKIFIASCEANDSSMHERIAKHQSERDDSWQLAEIPLELADFITKSSSDCLLLLDCLTLWLNNLIYYQYPFAEALDSLCDAVSSSPAPLIIISSELGTAPYHENALVREFVDFNGTMNQRLVEICSKVDFVTAGLAQTLKSTE